MLLSRLQEFQHHKLENSMMQFKDHGLQNMDDRMHSSSTEGMSLPSGSLHEHVPHILNPLVINMNGNSMADSLQSSGGMMEPPKPPIIRRTFEPSLIQIPGGSHMRQSYSREQRKLSKPLFSPPIESMEANTNLLSLFQEVTDKDPLGVWR
jgi:hypothetical protein